MAEILTQDEVNALMSAYGSGEAQLPEGKPTSQGKARVYDFMNPHRFTKEHLRTLDIIHSNFATGLAAILSGLHQISTSVTLVGTDQVSYKEYKASIPEKTLIAEVSAEPLAESMLIEVNPSIIGMWVDYQCGGNPELSAAPSELTPIDLAVAQRILRLCLPAYADAWSGLIAINPEITRILKSDSFDEPMTASEAMLVCSFEISTGSPIGMITLCIPAASVEAVLPHLSPYKLIRGTVRQDTASTGKVRQAVEYMDLPCSVVLGGSSISLSEARNLKVGDVIQTSRRIDGQLEMHIGGLHLFNCRPGMHGKSVAVVVTGVETPIAAARPASDAESAIPLDDAA